MADYATKQDVQEIVGKGVDKAVADLADIIARFGARIDERFNRLAAHADKFEESVHGTIYESSYNKSHEYGNRSDIFRSKAR